MKLVPADRITVLYQNSDFFDKILNRNKEIILKEVLADDIIVLDKIENSKAVEIGNEQIFLGVRKN